MGDTQPLVLNNSNNNSNSIRNEGPVNSNSKAESLAEQLAAVQTTHLVISEASLADLHAACKAFDESFSPSLPPSLKELEEQLLVNPFDNKTWFQLVTLIKSDRSKIDYCRNVYTRFLGLYHKSPILWMDYIQYECSLIGLSLSSAALSPITLSTASPSFGTSSHSPSVISGNCEYIERAFAKCLRIVHSPSLWILYLNYLKKKQTYHNKDVMIQAYEFALSCIGLDIHSGPIWMDYIVFLKSEKTESLFDEQVKMDGLRKIYQRAVQVPSNQLEAIWRDYDTFENNLNKMTARKILSDRSTAYMAARVAFKELKNSIFDPWQRQTMNDQESLTGSTLEQFNLMLALIAWERRNVLNLENTALQARITYAYELALCHHSLQIALLLEAVTFISKSGQDDNALSLLEDMNSYRPFWLPFSFYYAEILEQHPNSEKSALAKTVYEKLLENQTKRMNSVQSLLTRTKGQLSQLEKLKTDETLDDLDKIDLTLASIEEMKNALRLVFKENNESFLQVMRYIRRTEGLIATRSYFSRARKQSHCSPKLYSFSAQMEYYMAKDPQIAFKIYELGMKKFTILNAPDEMDIADSSIQERLDFFIEYMTLLLISMDDANAKALFERVTKLFQKESDGDDKNEVSNWGSPVALVPLLRLLISHEKTFGSHLGTLKSLTDRLILLLGSECTLNELDLLLIRSYSDTELRLIPGELDKEKHPLRSPPSQSERLQARPISDISNPRVQSTAGLSSILSDFLQRYLPPSSEYTLGHPVIDVNALMDILQHVNLIPQQPQPQISHQQPQPEPIPKRPKRSSQDSGPGVAPPQRSRIRQ